MEFIKTIIPLSHIELYYVLLLFPLTCSCKPPDTSQLFFLLLLPLSFSISFYSFFEISLFSPESRNHMYSFACIYIEVSPLGRNSSDFIVLYRAYVARFWRQGGCRGGICEKASGVAPTLNVSASSKTGLLISCPILRFLEGVGHF